MSDTEREQAIAPHKPKRRPVSQRVRFEVFKRDGFTCQYCGATPPGVLLHIDHMVAVAHGGDNSTDNLVTACEGCNLGKGAVPLTVVPQSLREKAAETAEREAQLRGYQEILLAKRQRLDDEAWRVIDAMFGPREHISRDWFNSARRFVDKLGLADVLEAAELAVGRVGWDSDGAVFRYFCGVCWNKIREGSRG